MGSVIVLMAALLTLLLLCTWDGAHSSLLVGASAAYESSSRSKSTRTVHVTWSANVSSTYPPSSPLIVRLGDKLKIRCPVNATSNVWIQSDYRQYNECSCQAKKNLREDECTPALETRQICQDEVLIDITSDSQNLKSALSFEEDTTYYLISYSPGNQYLSAYSTNTAGGECLKGFKMVLRVASRENKAATTTLAAVSLATTSGAQKATSTSVAAKETSTDKLNVQALSVNSIRGLNAASSLHANALFAHFVVVVCIITSFVYLYL